MSVRDDAHPLKLFAEWFAEAEKSEPGDPNAMALATADGEGRPSVRMVLMKGWDEAGVVFYTNLGSRKAGELTANPNAAVVFHWKSLKRQVRIEGPVTPVSAAEADAYFASRARISQIGAWASKQSQPLDSRFALEKRVAEITARYPIGAIPRPDHWSGFRIALRRMEFWREGAFRLHDRFVYERDGDAWRMTRLFP